MELYLLRPQQWERLFNCARIHVDDIPLGERYHPLNGTITVVLFIVFEVLYLPCMLSIYKHCEHSCYKLLFYIGLADMLMLCIHGLESGIFNFTGEMFCSNPHFNYISGSIGAGFFGMQTSSNFFLALDRVTDMLSPTLFKLLFDGGRVWFWMFASTLTALYFLAFMSPGLYNGIYMNWFMNPYEGYPVQINFSDYINPVSIYYNILLTFGFPAVYLLFISLFLYRLKEIRSLGSNGQANWKIPMFIQVALITGMNISSFLLFAVMQNFSINKVAILIEFYVNYFVFGFPPLIYLLFNKTIRTETRKMFGQILFRMAMKIYKGSASNTQHNNGQHPLSFHRSTNIIVRSNNNPMVLSIANGQPQQSPAPQNRY